MSAARGRCPRWAEIAVLPLVNIALAFLTVGIIVRIIGVDPFHALQLLVVGAIGSSESIGYTLYYTTNFIFTGLAVAVAFHAGLFNIGGEGQAYIGGLGCGLAILALDRYLPAPLMIPLAILAAAAVRRGVGGGAGLAAGLARQPHRHHHHHVQLPRGRADGLPDGERADRARLDDAAEPQLRGLGQAAVDARHAGRHRHPGGALGAQPVDRAGRAVLRRRLGVPVAHAVGLCAAHHGPQSRGRGLCRHQPAAHDHARHVHLGRRWRASSASTS